METSVAPERVPSTESKKCQASVPGGSCYVADDDRRVQGCRRTMSSDTRIIRSWQELASKAHWPPHRDPGYARTHRRTGHSKANSYCLRYQAVIVRLLYESGRFHLPQGFSLPWQGNDGNPCPPMHRDREVYTWLYCAIKGRRGLVSNIRLQPNNNRSKSP
ncbi:hypothetical protein N657DRAFT_426426 [Parathielavia appendiculata]|uniref:Uncharacterized protein n=1 Tax=Parathielavia appendiculata TaxID=2587402 RepID=A0AAN6Z3R9_9PEZI|nr:hypothetical protein N657DRAFT_426426 [Parathielavia appendiculata]